jgi:hypothetical protein
VKVFTSGYPQKIPVDYDHGSTTADPEVRKLRVQGQVPKAGDVLELRGVFAADRVHRRSEGGRGKARRAGRPPLDDARNFGLWMRWKPTARALAAIKAGEYTELSIAFDDDIPHNTTAKGRARASGPSRSSTRRSSTTCFPSPHSARHGPRPAAPGTPRGS